MGGGRTRAISRGIVAAINIITHFHFSSLASHWLRLGQLDIRTPLPFNTLLRRTLLDPRRSPRPVYNPGQSYRLGKLLVCNE
jgi:hypothetical protein